MSGPLLAIFPHPDDETFSAGGLIAAARERNVSVMLISATRGEAGESAIPGLDPDQLGAVREQELRDAMAHLGLADLRFLDYRDSGMEGSPEAAHPRAFVRAPVDQVAIRIAREIRTHTPATIVTFGPDGVYGHPDHLHLHQAVVRAVDMAANSAIVEDVSLASWRTPALYFSTAPREEMLAIFDRPNSPLPRLSEKARANLGTPRAEITHVLDVRPWEAQKLAAIRAHHTQTGEGGPLSEMPAEAFQDRVRWEHYIRASLPWGRIEETPDILDLLIASQ